MKPLSLELAFTLGCVLTLLPLQTQATSLKSSLVTPSNTSQSMTSTPTPMLTNSTIKPISTQIIKHTMISTSMATSIRNVISSSVSSSINSSNNTTQGPGKHEGSKGIEAEITLYLLIVCVVLFLIIITILVILVIQMKRLTNKLRI